LALNDTVRDPQTGRLYQVTWDGGKTSAPLVGLDPRYTRQRSDATNDYTRGAIGPLGLRPSDVKCEVKVDWPW
jgi:hypothetical protein